jgi:hypothetical protein
LHSCHRQPGTRPDGKIDAAEFTRFIDVVRQICGEAGRLDVCDISLGQILAHAPTDTTGIWPFEPARDVLDRPDLEKMRHGFQIGTQNKRGVTSRAYDEGGGQERQLASKYRAYAKALQSSHIYVAAALEQLAGFYDNDGLREDLSAKLRIEN